MKLVINSQYGGFSVSEEFAKKYNINMHDVERLRNFQPLIDAIENGENVNGKCARLEVVELPEETTDYVINEYDGLEELLYVVDGKINCA